MTRRNQFILAALLVTALLGGGIALGAQDYFAEDSGDPAATARPTPSRAAPTRNPDPTPTSTATTDGAWDDPQKVEAGL